MSNLYTQYKSLTLRYYNGILNIEDYIAGLKSLDLSGADIREYETVLSDWLKECENRELRKRK